MKAKQIDLLNIGLIFLSLIIAIKVPFHLFLLSYTILGPLHYLTELNWLNKQNFFSKVDRKWSIIFVILAICISIPALLMLLLKPKGYVPDITGNIIRYGQEYIPGLFGVALITSFGFAFLKNKIHILLLFIASLALSYFLLKVKFWVIMLGIMLPTLVHVYIFTLFFMWYGAIKSKSIYGYLGVLCMFLAIAIIYSIQIDGKTYMISESLMAKFFASNIQSVVSEIAKFANLTMPNGQVPLFAPEVIKIQIFIAFAYTYHYLNWFSKTSVIKWHLITKKESIIIFIVWGISVGLYFYDFQLGFTLLLFISVLHVFMEFPLNYISIAGTVKKYFALSDNIKPSVKVK